MDGGYNYTWQKSVLLSISKKFAKSNQKLNSQSNSENVAPHSANTMATKAMHKL
ncbi:hypothetical protein HDU98_005422, partial [Podochytrium sp. JEL0797]